MDEYNHSRIACPHLRRWCLGTSRGTPRPTKGLQYIFPASIAINGKQFSATFYESLFAQFQLVPGGQYAGYCAGTFGAISGCQQGVNITLTVTMNGATKSASALCPADGNSTSINLIFTTAAQRPCLQDIEKVADTIHYSYDEQGRKTSSTRKVQFGSLQGCCHLQSFR